jgi:phosphatidylethanolamine-binding protein (PEBP) family uncharacterized protein
MKRGLVAIGIVFALAVSGNQTALGASDPVTLEVDFTWLSKHKCSGYSPAFKITGIPDGTKFLKFNMTDLNYRSYPHGGGTVEYTGTGDIPEGAFRYRGPCPPSQHRYEFEVKALDASETVLGIGKAMRPFPPD